MIVYNPSKSKGGTMRTIRRSVFETNSSSVHTIAISASDQLTGKLGAGTDGVCEIYPGEFGWGIDTFYDAHSKASYCLTAAKQRGNTEWLTMLETAIKEVTGASGVLFCPQNDKYYPWGYIDHQSVGEDAKAFESMELLKNFIFNPASILVVDNDNH